MGSKKFAIENDTWEQMRYIKNCLNESEGKVIPWDDAFQHILQHYCEGGGIFSEKDSKEKKIIPSMNVSSIKSPSLSSSGIKAPNLPPSGIKAPILPPSGTNTPKMSPIGRKGKIVPVGSQNDDDLGIPKVPMKDPIFVDIDAKTLKKLKDKETDETKYILIECQICGDKPIMMPVPKKLVLESKLPVVDISYLHGDPQHVIVAQLDHDFQVRRRRASWIVFEKDY